MIVLELKQHMPYQLVHDQVKHIKNVCPGQKVLVQPPDMKIHLNKTIRKFKGRLRRRS